VREALKAYKVPRLPHLLGWNYDGDFTVMTVVHVPTQEVAYFGYDHPNAGLPVVQYRM